LLGFPEGYTWDDPGVPSVIVPYGRTSDFFFSGHCGFLMICACEWYQLGFKKMTYLTHCVNVYLAVVMLICRIHYSADITTGLIYGHYIYIVVRHFMPYMDFIVDVVWMNIARLTGYLPKTPNGCSPPVPALPSLKALTSFH
jgi:hypothetical protein